MGHNGWQPIGTWTVPMQQTTKTDAIVTCSGDPSLPKLPALNLYTASEDNPMIILPGTSFSVSIHDVKPNTQVWIESRSRLPTRRRLYYHDVLDAKRSRHHL